MESTWNPTPLDYRVARRILSSHNVTWRNDQAVAILVSEGYTHNQASALVDGLAFSAGY